MKILREFGRKQVNKNGGISYIDRLLVYSTYKIRRKSTGEIFNTDENNPLDIAKDLLNDFEDTNELSEVIEDEVD